MSKKLCEQQLSEKPASMAQLVVCPTDDQEVAGSTPGGSATFFPGDLALKYFL